MCFAFKWNTEPANNSWLIASLPSFLLSGQSWVYISLYPQSPFFRHVYSSVRTTYIYAYIHILRQKPAYPLPTTNIISAWFAYFSVVVQSDIYRPNMAARHTHCSLCGAASIIFLYDQLQFQYYGVNIPSLAWPSALTWKIIF